MTRLWGFFLLLGIIVFYGACNSAARGETDSDSSVSTDRSTETDTDVHTVVSTDSNTEIDTHVDTVVSTDSNTEFETEPTDCASAEFDGIVFSIPESAVCAYTEFVDMVVTTVTVTSENENTFAITNSMGIAEASCEKSDCMFLCRSLVLGTVDVDGEIEGDDTPRWASIEFSVELAGTVNSEGIESVNASLSASCGGPLCNAPDCSADVSDLVTWE